MDRQSEKITDSHKTTIDSQLVTAFTQLNEKINTEVTGQYGHTVIITTGAVTIKNSDIDLEFEIPFDDDTEANEGEIRIYNLTDSTINNIKTNAKITIMAGYGADIGIICSGHITKRKTVYEGVERVTTIRVIDHKSLKERDIDSITFSKNTRASTILMTLCMKLGFPIAVFKPAKDHTYTKEETVSGGLMDNIQRYAKICGVSAYVLKGKLYVRKLSDGDNTAFVLSSDTGLISCEEFEETETIEKTQNTIRGYRVTMLLQHRLQTASIITINSKNAKGRFRVRAGTHIYNGSEFITEAEVV